MRFWNQKNLTLSEAVANWESVEVSIKTLLMAVLSLALVGHTAHAVEVSMEQRVESRLAAVFGPKLEVRAVDALAGKQILEVTLVDGTIMHMTPDMNYFIYRDELYELGTGDAKNLTQGRLNPKRAASMQQTKDSDTVIFSAKGQQKAMINVFTDIECGFCQKLHQEIPRLNELGVTVRYLAFPRAGVQAQGAQYTDSYRKINAVWCAADRAQSMTLMKATQHDLSVAAQRARNGGGADAEAAYFKLEDKMGKLISSTKDCVSPVAAQYELGHVLGVTGTPAIITEQGDLIPGYMPADDLAKRLGVR